MEGIDLSDKNLTVIPREIALFRNMQTLFLYGNHLQSLEGVALPESLKRLDLRGNQIQNLEGVVLPKFLRELYLSGNQIQSLQGLAPLKSLRRLNLTNNRISELPNWIFQLPTNCEVNVAGNRLPTHLSTQISEIINRRREKGLDSPKIMF